MSSRFMRRPLAAAVLVAFSSPVLAQQARPEQTLPEVKVQGAQDRNFRTDSTNSATRTETPLRDIPQFINSVPQTLIRSQNATSLTDALRNVPGITYGAAEGGSQASQVFFLRGFPALSDLFIDGVRDLGEYNRDLFATESVEVLKGSSSLTFGRGSTGGVINQVSKVPDLLSRKELSLTLGSENQKRLTDDLNVRLGQASALRLNALAEKSGYYRYTEDAEKIGFAPSFWTRLGTATEATLSYYYLKTNDVTDYGQPALLPAATGTGLFGMPPVSADKYYGFANHDYSKHKTQIATFRLDHEFNNRLSLRNTLRWAKLERDLEATISTINAADNPGLSPATPLSAIRVRRAHDGGRTRSNDDGVLINQTELTWKLDAGDVKHTLLGGLELARERLDRWNYTHTALNAASTIPGTATVGALTPLLDPDPSTTLSYSKTPNTGARAEGDTVALYVQDQMELTKQWKALVGLRWERFAAKAETRSIATGAVTGSFARTDNMLSGRGGLIWQPTVAQSYYVSYGNSYNPSGELGVYGGTGTNLSAVNQTLDPEKNRNYEVGAHWDVSSGLQLRAALFRNEKTNARMADPITGLTVLAGRRRVEGLELEASGALTPNWDVHSGIAFMSGSILTGPANVQGNTPLGVADVAGNVWTVYRLGGGFELGGGVRTSSALWANDTHTTRLPSYALVDLTAAYVQPKYELRLNLYNLADKVYYTGGYQNGGNRVLPGQPRELALTVRYNFD